MARISFDNGNSFYDSDDLEGIYEELEEYDWEEVVNLMDDDVREETHMSFDYDEGDNLGFLVAYLRRADHDLVIW